ncbi:hypothetical protein F4553_001119 [Allocatelliglobosispora scoriae]|uniref:Uncharacterized protein n=1 Tax=Allocatelliglobosispora scoriae TaxID=643052 RepID=A0A841BLP3_9ACTN|nr:hypothetical protein [Allocatelliglobosispora scoriae]MBB5867740.1 hypothetical protein [Allocatelliglobosispora scoriae]
MNRPRWTARLAVLALALAAIATGAAPAQAATPDVKGWVLWDVTTASVAPSGTWPAATTVTTLSTGRYQVTFPGQGAPGGIVHVTAVSDSPQWCLAESWSQSGTSEVAVIRCHKIGGGPVASSFSAFFTKSSFVAFSPRPYGYVDSLATGSIVTQFNSSGGVNTSTPGPGPVGQWTVKFNGLTSAIGNPFGGGIQVTAVNANTATAVRCKVGGWSSSPSGQDIRVLCFDAVGSPVNTRFTVTYQYQVSLYGAVSPPNNHGYVLTFPNGGPADTNYNSVSGVGSNGVGAGTPGFANFPAIGVSQNTVQVTAHGQNPFFCNIRNPWSNTGSLLVVVACFQPSGGQVGSGFLVGTSSII